LLAGEDELEGALGGTGVIRTGMTRSGEPGSAGGFELLREELGPDVELLLAGELASWGFSRRTFIQSSARRSH
jgi:hypothetical protein